MQTHFDRPTSVVELSNELVRIHKRSCGKGPTQTRMHVSGDTVVCVMHGGLTRTDELLIDHGYAEAVIEQRRALHALMRDELVAAVESTFGRHVISIMPSLDPAARVQEAARTGGFATRSGRRAAA
jgi:uncharacterized protein YbcI